LFEVVVLRTNSVVNDPRVAKETSSQVNAGFSVLILAWARESGKGMDESRDRVAIKRLRLKAPIGAPSLILYFPLFWSWAFVQLLVSKPTVIHACDFDTMPVGLLIKMLKRETKLVYDCFEYYPGMVYAFFKSPLRGLISAIDRVFVKTADCVIIPCDERKKFYEDARDIWIVPNAPRVLSVPVADKKSVEFTLFYGGALETDRGIHIMIEAAIHLGGVRLVLAGDGTLRNIVRKFSEQAQNITYLGMLPHKDLLEKMAAAHATLAFYEATNPNNIYAASNKVFEAMMLGVPIITNEECVSSKIVAKHNCGLVVPYGDINALRSAISALKDNNELRRKLGENGRIAFARQYSWDAVELDFVRKYNDLVGTRPCKGIHVK